MRLFFANTHTGCLNAPESFLQDGSYSYCEFSRTFEEYDIQRVMRAYENSITVNVHCCDEGEWTQDRINAEQFSEFCQVSKSKWNE